MIIELLNQHGQVYLVRLPVCSEILAIENQMLPSFDKKIADIKDLCVGYLDMTSTPAKYIYTDGNHLYKESGKKVSWEIAEWIKK